MKPSRHRRTTGARTVPRSVTTAPGSMRTARVPSWMRTPRSRTARATPLTSLAGWTRAQSGSTCPDTAPATRIRSATWAAVSSPPRRSACAGERATCSTPLSRMSASMPSRPATAITSCTESRTAERIDASPASPATAAYARGLPGSSLDSQPPLRPEAPKPANSASTSRMSSVGSAACR